MARFLNGLNKDMTDIVEQQHYVELDDMVHMALKVERQLKEKSYGRAYQKQNWGKTDNRPSSKVKDDS